MALSGLRTLTVRIADRFSFSTSRQYSRALKRKVKFSFAMGSIPGPLKNIIIQLRIRQYTKDRKRTVKLSYGIVSVPGMVPGPCNRK
jgi:hypothetical protein